MKQTFKHGFYKLPFSIQNQIRIMKYILDRFLYLSCKNVKEKKVEKTIIILGMHRSGSSLTANILKEIGVSLGRYLYGPAIDNKKGFFENKKFVSLNNYLLQKAGGIWLAPPPSNSIENLKKDKKLIKLVENTVRQEEEKLWGWKDPRTSLLVELYYPLLKNPYFIICTRNKNSIAMSLHKRNKIPLSYGLNLSEIYYSRIKSFINNFPNANYLFVDFEETIYSESSQIKKIASFIGLEPRKDISVVDNQLVTSGI